VEYGIMLIGEIYKTLYKDFFNFFYSRPNLRASLDLSAFELREKWNADNYGNVVED
jgi:hypothetical protein